MSDTNPITSALVDQLEAAYTNPLVRDLLEREAYGVINVIDLLIDYAGDSDHADELEHYLRWECLNRQADERIIELHATRVEALLEVNVRAGNAAIFASDIQSSAHPDSSRDYLDALKERAERADGKWNVARLAHERAVEDHANLEEVLEASTDAKAHR
jgi:hypothetical protein